MREVLGFLGEPIERAKEEEDLHVMFEDVIKLWKNGLMQTRTIHQGDNVASKYVYTTEETKLIEHDLEFLNIQPRSTLVVYKTDTAESLLGKFDDVSNMKTFPVCVSPCEFHIDIAGGSKTSSGN